MTDGLAALASPFRDDLWAASDCVGGLTRRDCSLWTYSFCNS